MTRVELDAHLHALQYARITVVLDVHHVQVPASVIVLDALDVVQTVMGVVRHHVLYHADRSARLRVRLNVLDATGHAILGVITHVWMDVGNHALLVAM